MRPISDATLMRLATLVAAAFAVMMVGGKFFAFRLTGSLSVEASLVDSLLDACASIINFLAVAHALRPADAEHRFGHGKAEALAGLVQSLLISCSSFWLIRDIFTRFYTPQAIELNKPALYVMLVSTVLTTALIIFQRYVVHRTHSLAISADKLHYETDLLSNMGVMLTLGISSAWQLIYLDILVAIVIAVYILHGSWAIVSRSFDVLMDKELPTETLEKIQEIVLMHPKALGIHDLRTRSSGHTDFIQMHVDMNEALTLKEAHAIADEIEESLLTVFPKAQIIIHQDPVCEDLATLHHVFRDKE
jgi:ferrous-iron efflux pump FieF